MMDDYHEGMTVIDLRRELAEPMPERYLIDYDEQQANYGPARSFVRDYPEANPLTLADYPPSFAWGMDGGQ